MTEQICSINGIKLCTFLNPNLRSFCVSVYVRAGSIFENTANNGISHLFEHTVIRNLKNKYDHFYDQLACHGIDLQGCTYKEFIRLTIEGLSSEFDFALDVLCSLFDEIRLTTSEFNNEKKRIKAEIREKDERASLDYHFNKLVWIDSEAEKTVLGYCKALDRISLKQINHFRKECFSDGNCMIYVSGNVAERDVEKLKQRIQMLEIACDQPKRRNTVSVNKGFFNRSIKVNVKEDYWHYIKIGFDIDCSRHTDGVLDILYAILFKGPNALIHHYLSEENPMIYSYDSTLEQYDNVGNISFKFEIDQNKIEEAITVIVQLLKDLKSGGFHFEANLKAEMYEVEAGLDRPDELNWNLAYYNHLLKTSPIDYNDEFFGRFRISKEQVMDAAKEIFRSANLTVAMKGKKRKLNIQNIENALKALDE